jgi:hypothetical protein
MRTKQMKKDNSFAIFALILLLTVVFLAVSAVRPAFAANESGNGTNEIVLVVRPLVIMNYSAVPGQRFDVSINVTALGALNLHGFTMRLGYDPTLVNCIPYVGGLGDIFNGFSITVAPSIIDNALGNVYVSINLTSQSATVNNNGTLFTFRFQVKGTGETSLHVHDAVLYGIGGSHIQFTAYDGYFNNKFNFDLTMPLILLAVTFASLFLNLKTESKLKGVFEEREFRVRDAVLLVGLMTVMITLIVVVQQLSTVLMVLFLFSYSLLLYTFSYLLFNKRWYVGIIPSAVFILLYVFLRDSFVWTYYLSNVYGLVFAILITLYLASLFNWKTTAVFGVLITAMDVVLVLVTKTMVQAATAAASLGLPVLVSLPLVPLIMTGTGLLPVSLGLGDFFFAGLLAIQTFKKYGKRLAIASVVGMTISFSLFEAFILTYRIGGFPGTLMIICGWVPFVLVQTLRNWRKTEGASLKQVVSG